MTNTAMNPRPNNKLQLKLFATFIFGAVLVYVLVNSLTQKQFQDLELQTRLLISQQEAVLATIAETTARNGADSVTELIVRDCTVSEGSAFDTLLGNLNSGLSRTQLIELERLFGRCGGFFSERKSVMVARLSREIEVYETYVAQLSAVLNEDVSETFLISGWNKLAEEEQKQSELFSQLVSKQDDIISTLLTGKAPESEEITEILREVKEIQDTLIVTKQQVTNVRTELVSF